MAAPGSTVPTSCPSCICGGPCSGGVQASTVSRRVSICPRGSSQGGARGSCVRGRPGPATAPESRAVRGWGGGPIVTSTRKGAVEKPTAAATRPRGGPVRQIGINLTPKHAGRSAAAVSRIAVCVIAGIGKYDGPDQTVTTSPPTRGAKGSIVRGQRAVGTRRASGRVREADAIVGSTARGGAVGRSGFRRW